MGMLVQSGRFGDPLAGVMDYAWLTQAYPASTFNTSSSSFVNQLNGSGGSTITCTAVKAAGTNLLVACGSSYKEFTDLNNICVGLNDGASDYEMGRSQMNSTNSRQCAGERLFTGLGAGSYTYTLRMKTGGTRVDFTADDSAYIRIQEVTQTGKVVNFCNSPGVGTQQIITTTTYIDLKTGSGGTETTFDAVLNKTRNASRVLVRSNTQVYLYTTDTGETAIVGVNDGTTDYDLGRNRELRLGDDSRVMAPQVGARIITGQAAGTYTYRLRVKSIGGVSLRYATNSSGHITVIEIDP